jgi:hypothetical protein
MFGRSLVRGLRVARRMEEFHHDGAIFEKCAPVAGQQRL